MRIEWWGNLGHRSNIATEPAPFSFDRMNRERLNAVAEKAMHLRGADLVQEDDAPTDKSERRWRVQAQFIRQTEILDSILQTMGGIQILYCHDKNQGIWFIPHTGFGPLPANGLDMLKRIVETGSGT